ncbi:MAG: glycosyltransferase [Desulfobacterales bacterium]|jgi:GR25 family glycosyltransferase involved in LPS biosynthesis|nr:glycosyltransferase [Desulfobacterales bacterium]
MNQIDHSSAWDFFDRIYCISLRERIDRRRQALEQFQRVGLASRVEFVMVERHPLDCEQGIYESHQQCIRRGLATDADTILIFEDDVMFERFNAERLIRCAAFLQARSDWKAFFLGCLSQKSRKTEAESVAEISYRCLAHAYALNRPFAETVARKPWCKVPFDGMIESFAGGFYAMYPACAFQSDAPSDNFNHRLLDGFRRCMGGLKRIQKVNEWRLANRNLLVALHLAALLALAVWAWRAWS